jgi:hypothetical protein
MITDDQKILRGFTGHIFSGFNIIAVFPGFYFKRATKVLLLR